MIAERPELFTVVLTVSQGVQVDAGFMNAMRRRRRAEPSTHPVSFEKVGMAPEDVDIIQLQDTGAGAQTIPMAECGFCADGEQEKLLADGATEITGSADQHRRRSDGQR